MYHIGDNVLYGSNGVMTVVDIREELVGAESRRYYVMRAYGSRGESLIYVPCDNEKLVSAMRPLLTEDEARDFIEGRVELPEIEWVSENRARGERFKAIVESGDRAAMLAMIKAVHLSGLVREREGKKNYLTDEGLKQKAERILSTELSLVLGVDESELPSFV